MRVVGWASVGFERDGLGKGLHCIKIVFPHPSDMKPTVRLALSDAEQLGEALILSVRSGEEQLAKDKRDDQD